MTSLDEYLQRWRRAGLLDEHAIARITAFERNRPESHDDRPGLLESALYVGVAVAGVGAAILISASWSALAEWARFAVFLLPAIFALAAGFALRSLGDSEFLRGAHVTWVAGTALAGAAAATLAAMFDVDGKDVGLAAGTASSVVALALWFVSPSHPQVLALAGALVFLSCALGARGDEFSPLVAGLAVAALGLAAVYLAEAGEFAPRSSARMVAGTAVGSGAYFAGFEGNAQQALVFVAAAFLVFMSIRKGVFTYIVLGIATGFLGLLTTTVRNAADPATAALALIVVGAVMVAVVVVLARVRPWRRRPRT